MHTHTTQIKKLLNLSITIILIISILSTTVYAADSDDPNYDYALKLKELGVFVGTGSGFELNRVPTRIEGVVMLVRLLGKEDDAMSMANTNSIFTDVPSWAKGYVNYAKAQGLTNGVSSTSFGSNDPMSAEMYVTFLLRSLGYDDTKGDFNWKESLTKAKSINMITSTTTYTSTTFIRSHIAKLSYDALLTNYNKSTTSLGQYLVNIGALDKTTAIAINIIDNPAVVNGKLYALKDTSFYSVGDNDCYVDVVASASISGAKKNDVYIHQAASGDDSYSLLTLPVSGYSRLFFRVIHENTIQGNKVYILKDTVTSLSSAQSLIPYKTFPITKDSQAISIDLSAIDNSTVTLYIEGFDGGTIFVYNLFLE